MNQHLSLDKKINKLTRLEAIWLKKLGELQTRRLWLGLSVFLLLVCSQIVKGFYLELLALFAVLPAFLFYMKVSRRVLKFCGGLSRTKAFYLIQLDFRKGVFHKNQRAEEMFETQLARDLDLGVFFANINQSFSQEGQNLLNHWLCQDFKDSTREERQKQLQKMGRFPGLVRKLQTTGGEGLTHFSKIENEVCRSFFPKPLPWKWLIPLSWFCLIVCLMVPMPSIVWKVFLLTYAGTVLAYLNHTQHLFSRLQDLHQDFSQLGEKIPVLEHLGSITGFSPHLSKNEVSRDVRQMSTMIALMSFKSNPILFYILNLILPWDFLLAEISERKRKQFYSHFKSWSLEVVKLDALGSLANLIFYHDTHWPEVIETPFLEFKEMSHPLLNQDTVVKNDFMPADQSVFIITGSNMSGKSTFLRAVGLNFCLANIGVPVFAKLFKFKPMTLASCIRVSDSLRDGQSYFYAEVQRMKSILKKSSERPVLFLIDEPLRGTNNRERLIGNKAYLKQILEQKAQGFISTHDLELTQLADESDSISNCHFSDQWIDEELFFDYKIKEGPSKTTNALKILAREGLYSL